LITKQSALNQWGSLLLLFLIVKNVRNHFLKKELNYNWFSCSQIILLSNILALSVPDVGYSRNASCVLNLISTFFKFLLYPEYKLLQWYVNEQSEMFSPKYQLKSWQVKRLWFAKLIKHQFDLCSMKPLKSLDFASVIKHGKLLFNMYIYLVLV
jgi:hypothetical protein